MKALPVGEASNRLGEAMAEHPLVFVGAAFGLGYILAGGLFTPTTNRMLRLGLKVAAIPVVRNQLLNVAEAAVDSVIQQAKK